MTTEPSGISMVMDRGDVPVIPAELVYRPTEIKGSRYLVTPKPLDPPKRDK